MKVYHVEPFYPELTEKVVSKQGGRALADRLAAVLNEAGGQGRAFEGYHRVEMTVRSGCLGIPLGSRDANAYMLVFSKDE
jgi:hypothetical protein